jgi:hypothetical protein
MDPSSFTVEVLIKIPFFSRGKMGSSSSSGFGFSWSLGIKVVVMAQELPQSMISTVTRCKSVEPPIKSKALVVIYDDANFFARGPVIVQ